MGAVTRGLARTQFPLDIQGDVQLGALVAHLLLHLQIEQCAPSGPLGLPLGQLGEHGPYGGLITDDLHQTARGGGVHSAPRATDK